MSKPKINTEMIGALDYLEKEKGYQKEFTKSENASVTKVSTLVTIRNLR